MDVLGIVLAGGRGERLAPLTDHRAKPAVPFGGRYRIIDFVLSNFVNSGILSIYVLTQFKAQSLLEHLEKGWRTTDYLGEHFITAVPAQMRLGGEWYQGTADSVYQNLYLIERHHPRLVAVFGADHIYRMNIRQMIEEHERRSADVTVAALPVKIEEASAFGVMEIDSDWRVIGFEEKPERPKSIPGEPGTALVSMGNYVFNADVLIEALTAEGKERRHDFGRDHIPALIRVKNVYAYDFRKNRVPVPFKGEEASYWRDLGTIEAYYEANMDLCSVDPSFNLYNRSWPLRTVGYGDPPAKFVFDWPDRQGMAINSLVAEGTIISGSVVRNCVVGRNVRIHSYSLIQDSVIMDWVEIARGCRIRRAIIDKSNVIPPGTEIGYDLEKDRRRYFVSETGIVVIPRAQPKTAWITTGHP
ncbi:MAG TPA: glucose-1-phosphate adenylyltransferase [candidate division Zixibacteria bacterium]|nr:glucose-1-phosphate adenylyltransferase [candidate division Zixibacteria bacterium]